MKALSFERIKELLKLLSRKEYLEKGKLKKTSFTRKRKITYKEIFLCILNKKGKTLALELKEYMKKINKEEIVRVKI